MWDFKNFSFGTLKNENAFFPSNFVEAYMLGKAWYN